jgi:hypothetical protein
MSTFQIKIYGEEPVAFVLCCFSFSCNIFWGMEKGAMVVNMMDAT